MTRAGRSSEPLALIDSMFVIKVDSKSEGNNSQALGLPYSQANWRLPQESDLEGGKATGTILGHETSWQQREADSSPGCHIALAMRNHSLKLWAKTTPSSFQLLFSCILLKQQENWRRAVAVAHW